MKPAKLTKRFNPHRIRDARAMFGLSPYTFGSAIGKTDQTVRNWESGKTSPTIRDLEHICEHFGFDLSYFVDGKAVTNN